MSRLTAFIISILFYPVLAASAFAVLPESGARTKSSTVPISLLVPGWLRLDVTQTPIAVAYDPLTPSTGGAAIPLQVSWNLNPNLFRGVEVISYFSDPNSALVGSGTQQVRADVVIACQGSNTCQRFGRQSEGKSAVTLFRESLSHANAKAHRNLQILIQLSPSISLQPDVYTGIIFFEARCF